MHLFQKKEQFGQNSYARKLLLSVEKKSIESYKLTLGFSGQLLWYVLYSEHPYERVWIPLLKSKTNYLIEKKNSWYFFNKKVSEKLRKIASKINWPLHDVNLEVKKTYILENWQKESKPVGM